MSERLSDLNVVLFDCQATGSNPQCDMLLEVGWARYAATRDPSHAAISAHLVQPETDAELPRRISRITGISREQLVSDGVEVKRAANKMKTLMSKVASVNNGEICPLVIHYARFESRWLQSMFAGSRSERPYSLLCTHEIARRLFSDLPRRGLRAIAGFLGYTTAQMRRSKHHVAATAFIWSKIVPILADQERVVTLSELREWLAGPKISAGAGRAYPMQAAVRKNIPAAPGIYKMFRSNGDILYVGKATSLRSRVNSYFTRRGSHGEHILEMLAQAADIKVETTATILEAALREHDEIKRLAPPYNKALRTNEREVYYFTNALTGCRTTSSSQFCVGPLPSPEALLPFEVLTQTLEHPPGSALVHDLLASYGRAAPQKGVCAAGVQLFLDEWRDVIAQHQALAALKIIGTLSHQRKLEEAALAQDSQGESPDAEDLRNDEKKQEFEWTPERVEGAITGQLRWGMYLIRRSRWYLMLSNASVMWESPNCAALLCLDVRKGQYYPIERFESLPGRPRSGLRRAHSSRRRDFDIACYDRMRVLTAELRRIVKSGRKVYLHVGPQSCLSAECVAQLLQWV
ncbi:MAG: hypothetical protein GF398_20790 [Chitinivibrionales bacterium]|nr:hypothetical protein [Chitinivibrionales bacterium]